MSLSAEVKARVSLRQVVEQSATWDAGKSNPGQGDYWAPCPLHGEATPSFHVTEPKGAGGVFHCFGCQATGSVIDFVMARDGLDFTAALRALADAEQIDRVVDPARQARIAAEAEARQRAADQEAAAKAAKGLARAQVIWRQSEPDHPKLTEYLEARGIDLGAIGGVPATLRFHPDLPCRDGGKVVHRGPAMVAAIGCKTLVGIHRTWIDPGAPCQGRAKAWNGGKVPKQMLGQTGAIFGQPVLLSKRGAEMMIVGEGIETTLAGLARARRDGIAVSAEAALSLPALSGPGDNTGRPNKRGRAGKPIPTAKPDLTAEAGRAGWLPPKATMRAVILADPSTKCPETAEAFAARAQAKIAARCPQGARLAIPRGHWDHDADFADLAKLGAL